MYYTDEILRKASYEDFVAREMYERRKEIIKESSNVVGQDYAEEILKLITAAHAWDMPEADIFIKHLNLTDKDFCCITDDRQRYKDILLEEQKEYYYGWDYVEA